MRLLIIILFIQLFVTISSAQLMTSKAGFSRKDTLRGMLTPLRTCYDVHYYHLDIEVDPEHRSIKGSNAIYFQVLDGTEMIQVDLFENMEINNIILDGKKKLKFEREYDAVFIEMPDRLPKGSLHQVKIEYEGIPVIAKRPPWDGGFIWAKDSVGNPWVAVTVQGTGASLWWPNKDHQSDEPDSMMISIAVPDGLENISNGRLRSVEQQKNGWKKYNWFVSYPINNYNVTVNIGKFAHFEDVYIGSDHDTLTLDYYVLPQELEKAKHQFTQVKPMMDFFYEYFGPYPFIRDGYKLIQSPHLGMEHQSAVAYGNGYLNGFYGTGSSEVALTFDFIIQHETGHEWWGNNITTNDIADMWVHESFTAYSEGLYVEYVHGYDEAMKYINGKKQSIQNDRPIIGPFDVNTEGSGDMYNKGQLVLNTLRHVIDNDELWKKILKGMNRDFRHQTIDGQQIFNYIEEHSGMELTYFFDQYFRHASLPELRINVSKKGDQVKATYRWRAEVPDFKMPVKIMTSPGKFEFIYPTTKESKSIELHGIHPDQFAIQEDQFFMDLKITKTYIDPRK